MAINNKGMGEKERDLRNRIEQLETKLYKKQTLENKRRKCFVCVVCVTVSVLCVWGVTVCVCCVCATVCVCV